VRGSATLSETTIRLGSNFKSSDGPDLYVYLGNSKPTRQIGKLRRTSGAQSYKLPSGVDASKYRNVFIHCKRYNHIFGRAKVN